MPTDAGGEWNRLRQSTGCVAVGRPTGARNLWSSSESNGSWLKSPATTGHPARLGFDGGPAITRRPVNPLGRGCGLRLLLKTFIRDSVCPDSGHFPRTRINDGGVYPTAPSAVSHFAYTGWHPGLGSAHVQAPSVPVPAPSSVSPAK